MDGEDSGCGELESPDERKIRIRKGSVFHFKKRENLPWLAEDAADGGGSPNPGGSPKISGDSPSRRTGHKNAGGGSRPHSAPAPLVSRRDKAADRKAVKTRPGERSWRGPALLLAASKVEAATEGLAGEIEGALMRDEHRKLEKLGLLGAGGTMREDLEAGIREQGRVEALHRKMQRMQADLEEKDMQIAEKDATILEQGKKTKVLQLTVQHLKEEMSKPSEAEKLAVAAREEALERLKRQERLASVKSAKILEQSQKIKKLEVVVSQLKLQLEARPVEPKVLKKIHRAPEIKLKPRKKLTDVGLARTMGLLNILPEYSPRAAQEAVARTKEERAYEAKSASRGTAVPLEVSDL